MNDDLRTAIDNYHAIKERGKLAGIELSKAQSAMDAANREIGLALERLVAQVPCNTFVTYKGRGYCYRSGLYVMDSVVDLDAQYQSEVQ